MFYWLFTDGRELLSRYVVPLTLLTLLAPLLTTALLGAGIQRSSESRQTSGWKHIAKIVTHVVALVGISAVYVVLLGDMAVQTTRERADDRRRVVLSKH